MTETDENLRQFQANGAIANSKSKGYQEFDYIDSSDSKSEAGDTQTAGEHSEIGHGRKGLKKFQSVDLIEESSG